MHSLVDATFQTLITLDPVEFSHIEQASTADQPDSVRITYSVNSQPVALSFTVKEPLVLSAEISLQAEGEHLEIKPSSDQYTALVNTFCTAKLYTLIKRYQFLLNSSKHDSSLHEFFTEDLLGQPTKVDFYPLMRLLTAYYESH